MLWSDHRDGVGISRRGVCCRAVNGRQSPGFRHQDPALPGGSGHREAVCGIGYRGCGAGRRLGVCGACSGRCCGAGESKYPTDGPEVVVFDGDIPEHERIVDLTFNGSEIENDPNNAHAVAQDVAKGARNARRGRLRDDVADPSARGGMPGLSAKVDDMLATMNEGGQLEDES